MVRVTISFRVIKQASLHCKLLVARKTLKLYFFPDMTICAVHGCLNSDYKLKSWKAQDCVIHVGTKNGIGRCIGLQPFTLHSFPTERKDPDTRRRLTHLLDRKVRAHIPTGNQSDFPGFVGYTSLMTILLLKTHIQHCYSDTRQPVQLPELESHEKKDFQLHHTVKPTKHKRQNNITKHKRENNMHHNKIHQS